MSISLDPIDPPPGELTEAERLLWAGKCPWCGAEAAWVQAVPDDPTDDSLACSNCGVELTGPQLDEPGKLAQRGIDTVFKLGDPAMQGGAPDSLPEVVARAPRRRIASTEQEP